MIENYELLSLVCCMLEIENSMSYERIERKMVQKSFLFETIKRKAIQRKFSTISHSVYTRSAAVSLPGIISPIQISNNFVAMSVHQIVSSTLHVVHFFEYLFIGKWNSLHWHKSDISCISLWRPQFTYALWTTIRWSTKRWCCIPTSFVDKKEQ